LPARHELQYTWSDLMGIDGETVVTFGLVNALSHRPWPIEDSGGFDGFLDGQGHLGRIWNLCLSHRM
jgi:hypothetical protein